MNKTGIAIAVMGLMTATAAANAAVVYNQDGTNVNIHGRLQAYLNNGYDVDSTRFQHTDLSAAARLGADATFMLSDQFDAILASEWQVNADKNDGNTGFTARNIYVGFDGHQYGQVTFGQNDNALYTGVTAITDQFNQWGNAAVVSGGREAGIVTYDLAYMGLGVHLSGGAHSDKLNAITYATTGANSADTPAKQYNKGGLSSFVTSALGSGASSVQRNNTYALALNYSFDFKDAGALGVAGGYQSTDFDAMSGAAMNNWALGASYTWKGLYFGGVYNQSKVDNGTMTYKAKGYEIALTYVVNDQWKLLSGYNKLTSKDFANAQETAFTSEALLGVQYNFTPELKAYTEYKIAGQVTTTGTNVVDPDNQWVVSLQYNF